MNHALIVAGVTQTPIRICIVGLNYSPEPTGNAPYTTSLAEGLAALGHEVHVVTGYPHYPEWKLASGYVGWSSQSYLNGVSVLRLRHHVPSNPRALSRMHMELSFGIRVLFAKWKNPDVVLFVSPALFSSALGILRARLRPNRPSIGLWVQDLYSRGVVETAGRESSRLGTLMKTVESFILRATDGVVAIHDRFRSYIVDSLKVAPENVRVVRNWTHLGAPPSSGLDSIRSGHGWSTNETVVLHAGNMGKKQGLENVIDAARIAQEQKMPVRFVLMGDGNQRNRIEKLADGLTHLQLIPPLPEDEFQAALAAADILLVNELPGLKDMAVPSKLTSYFNAGVPVIAATEADSVTARELEVSGGGLRVDPGNPKALLAAISLLRDDPATAAGLASNGLRFRYDTLSEEAAMNHYDVFLSSLASLRGH